MPVSRLEGRLVFCLANAQVPGEGSLARRRQRTVGRCRGWPESAAVRVGQVARGTQLAPGSVRRIRVPGWLGRIGIRPGRANTFVPDRIKNLRRKRFVRFDCKSTVLKSLDPLPRQGNSSLRDVPFQNDEAAACPIMDSGVRLPFI